MIIFWTLVAGLIGLALLFVLPPILGKHENEETVNENQVNLAVFRQQLEELDADLAAGNLEQSQYEASRRDLEKELLADIEEDSGNEASGGSGRWAAGVLALALPAMSIALYLHLGDHEAIERPTTRTPPPMADHAAPAGEEMPSMDVLVQRLAERMEADPNNLEGWLMLGRSYTSMGEHDKAIGAYQRANALAPDEPNVMLGLAEAMARIDGQLDGKPEELIDQALELEPNNANGLFMKGMALYQRGDYEGTLSRWKQVEAMLDPNSEDAAALRGYMTEARQQAGMPTEEAPPAISATAATEPAPAPSAAGGGSSVKVAVSLAPEMAGKFAPEDTLFVFARAAAGPPMPLAVQRLQAKDLPVSLTLDDSMAMMPQMRLSNFDQVVIGARISKSGNAMPQSGDLQGEVQPVSPGQDAVVAVVIDGVRP